MKLLARIQAAIGSPALALTAGLCTVVGSTACAPPVLSVQVQLATATCNGGMDPLANGQVIRFTVFGDGINSTNFQTSSTVASGTATIPSIPVGTNRNIVAEVLDSNQNVLSRGETGPLTLNGKTQTLSTTIFLRPVNSFSPAVAAAGGCTSLQTARIAHTATVLESGNVLIAGGYMWMGSTQVWLNTTEIYNPQTGTITPGPSMSTSRAYHTATHIPGTNYTLIVGGENAPQGSESGGALGTAEIFDEGAQAFDLLPQLPPSIPNGITRHTAAVPLANATSGVPGIVIIQGGQDLNGNPIPHVLAYTVNNGLLDTGIEFSEGRSEATAVPIPCGVLLFGGWGGTAKPFGPLKDVAGVTSPDCATFSAFSGGVSLADPHIFPLASALADGSIAVMDGFSNQGVNGMLTYASSAVDQLVPPPYGSANNVTTNIPADKRGFGIGVGLLDGTMLAAGGGEQPSGGNPVASQTGDIMYVHSGTLASRPITSLMHDARIGAAAVLMNDGTVLISGGYNLSSNEAPQALSSIDIYQPEYQISISATTSTAHLQIQ